MKSITDNNNNINYKLALSAFLPKPFPMNPMIDILLKKWVQSMSQSLLISTGNDRFSRHRFSGQIIRKNPVL